MCNVMVSFIGYDGHHIIRAVEEKHGNIRVIPTTMEKFMSFSVGQLQFLDSFQFASKGLDKLVATLDDSECKHLRKEFSSDEEFYLMRQKGVFPYDFLDNITKLTSNEPIDFPEREAFRNKKESKDCPMKDWLHGKTVWNAFDCKTFKNYHDLYLKQDVLLLADFFEKFRSTCHESYGLDPCHYFSAPGNSCFLTS